MSKLTIINEELINKILELQKCQCKKIESLEEKVKSLENEITALQDVTYITNIYK